MTYFDLHNSFKARLRYRWYRFLWAIAPYVSLPFPIHLDIESNSHCNLQCPICHQTDNPRVYSLRKMTWKEIIGYIDEAKELGVKSLKFNWRGESLLWHGEEVIEDSDRMTHVENKDFFDVLEYALEKDFTDILVNTNLSIKMDEKQLSILAKVPHIKVSIDSISNYAVARKGGNLRHVINNMMNLIARRMHQKSIIPVIETNRHESDVTEPFQEYVESFEMMLGSEFFQYVKLHNHTAQPRNHSDHFIKSQGFRERKYCGQPSRRLLISATTKKVYPCCVPYGEPEDMNVGYGSYNQNQYGEVMVASLKDTWKGQKRKTFVRELKKRIMKTDSCINCVATDAWK